MIDLYHFFPTRSVRVLWALEELGLPYRLHRVEVPFRDNLPKDIGHSGMLPVAIDDADGRVMTESLAICELLARRHGNGRLLVEPAAPNYQAYIEYLWFGEATMGPFLRPLKFMGPSAPAERQNLATYYWAKGLLEHRMQVLEDRLSDHGFLAGDELTLADISVGYPLFTIESAQEQALIGPRTASYWARIKARPAFIQAHSPDR